MHRNFFVWVAQFAASSTTYLGGKTTQPFSTEHPYFEGALSMKYLVPCLQRQVKSVLIDKCSSEMKLPFLLSPISEYVFAKNLHSPLYFHHDRYVA